MREDIKSGAIPSDKKEILEERIKALEKIYNRMYQFLPLIEKIIGRTNLGFWLDKNKASIKKR